MKQLLLKGTAPAVPPISIAKTVVAGAIFAPFAALLAFRPEAAEGIGRPLLMISSVVAGALTSFLCSIPARLPEPASPKRLAIGCAFGLAGVVASTLTMELGWRLGHGNPAGTVDILSFSSLLAFWTSFVLLYLDHNRSRQKMLNAQTQLRSLETRIQPHFFFNTLNTISAFIPTQPETSQMLIGRLASLYRQSLPRDGMSMSTLSAELELTQQYLEIEKARFGERLSYTLPSNPGSMRIPSLTLQHLAENAIRHGIAHLPEGGVVHIDLDLRQDSYEITVSNPVEDSRDIQLETLLKEGHSLQLLADRMRLIYRGQAKFQLELDGVFRARITIPTAHKFNGAH